MMVASEKSSNTRVASSGEGSLFNAAIGDSATIPVPPVQAAGILAENLQFLTDQLNALRRDYTKLQQAVFEAAQVQRNLCAPRELSWGAFEVAGEIFPVRNLSGDFFKVMEFDSGLALALGDIAGKGMTAGIWQPHVMSLIQRAARARRHPVEVVAEVNAELSGASDNPPITALFFACIDSRTNELIYCNAGLPAPLLLRANRSLERLDQGGPMLGALPTAVFRSGTVTLDPGDTLVAYSDGVTECRNSEDDEFEMDRLTAAVKSVTGFKADKALFSLLGTVLDFAGSRSPGDDVTLMVIRNRDAIKSGQPSSGLKDFETPQRKSSGSRPKASVRGGRSSR